MTLSESRENIGAREISRPGRPAAALLIVSACALAAWLGIRAVHGWSGAPYNVRELFPSRHVGVYQAAFAVLLVWIGLGPAWVGGLLVRRPGLVKLMPAWTATIGLASWVLLRFSVTRESLADILGSPTLRWGGDWEFIGRFIALQAVVTIMLIASAVTVGGVVRLGWSRGLRLGAAAVLWSLPWLCLAWVVVIDWTHTDNLTELIRSRPLKWAGPACLTAAVAVVGLHGSALGHAVWRRAARSGVIGLAAALATPLAVAAAWAMVYLGLDPAVTKYGHTFPALRFLLAPNRKAALCWNELFLRFSAVQIAATALLACGGAAGLLLWPSRRDGGTKPGGAGELGAGELGAGSPPARHPGRAMLAMMLIYMAMLFYGSLVPLDFRDISFGQAWDAFWHSNLVFGARLGQSDMVTNIVMTIPLTFLAVGAWSRAGPRRGFWYWYMAPVVFAGSVAVSVCLEFSQVFTANRSPSIHDMIAQAIGAVVGLAAWLLAGEHLCRWVRGLFANRPRADLARRILWTYAGLLVLYELLPLNPTISLSQIMARFQHGMINLVPFADPVYMGLYATVMKAAVYAPIGVLAATAATPALRPWRRILRALLCGLGFSLAMETLQAFIVSRIATSSDVVLGTIGSAVGGAVACFAASLGSKRAAGRQWWGRYGAWVKLAVALGWLMMMAWRRWYPFEFAWPAQRPQGWPGAAGGLGAALAVPPFNLVRSIGPLDAMVRLSEEFISLLVFGMLLQALLARGRGRPLGSLMGRMGRRLAVGAAAAAIGVLMEAARLMFSRVHGPDLTVALVGLAGSAAAVWAYPRFVKVFMPGPDNGATA